jgi:hypothetical protein
MSPQEYRNQAVKCRSWADDATDCECREAFLDLAARWEAAALVLEANGVYDQTIGQKPAAPNERRVGVR